ncbi:MAG TPA: prefoldin subunit alpha [Candidatus Korarchaeota archaeon]|nr:prefoldin subunit alpha [Candidatus Korarchaeota archaeon]
MYDLNLTYLVTYSSWEEKELSSGGAAEDLETLSAIYRALVDEANRLNMIINDLVRSKETLRSLKSLRDKKEGVERMIVPAGSFIGLLVENVNPERVLVLLGSNVYAEMSLERAIEELDSRIEQGQKALESIQSQINQIEEKINVAMRKAQKGTKSKSSS